MPSVYKRKLKDGTYWYGSIKLPDGTWKSFSTHLTTTDCTKHQAEAFVARQQFEMDSGHDTLSEPVAEPTLADMAEEYLKARAPYWSTATVESVQITFRSKLLPMAAKKSLRQIDRDMVQDFMNELLPKMSPHSVNVHLRNLRTFLHWIAQEKPDWKCPPVKLIRAPGQEHRDNLSAAELNKVLVIARDMSFNKKHEIAPFFAFLAFTGMRRGEALTCEWEWIRGGFIHIPGSRTKTQQKRSVPITAALQAVLTELPEPRTGRLFPNLTKEVGRLFPEACKRAGIERALHLHNLRDTFIVQCLLLGIPAKLVADMAGNSVRIIEQNYSWIAKEDLAGAAMRLTQGVFSTNFLPDVPSN
jgi:integrase